MLFVSVMRCNALKGETKLGIVAIYMLVFFTHVTSHMTGCGGGGGGGVGVGEGKRFVVPLCTTQMPESPPHRYFCVKLHKASLTH